MERMGIQSIAPGLLGPLLCPDHSCQPHVLPLLLLLKHMLCMQKGSSSVLGNTSQRGRGNFLPQTLEFCFPSALTALSWVSKGCDSRQLLMFLLQRQCNMQQIVCVCRSQTGPHKSSGPRRGQRRVSIAKVTSPLVVAQLSHKGVSTVIVPPPPYPYITTQPLSGHGKPISPPPFGAGDLGPNNMKPTAAESVQAPDCLQIDGQLLWACMLGSFSS